jgi:ankyrin repeat protein
MKMSTLIETAPFLQTVTEVETVPPLLETAVLSCNIDIIITLCLSGHDPNTPNKDGHSPLTIASKRTNATIVRILLDAGGNVDGVDNLGFAHLYHAIYHNRLDIVQLLIERGCSKHFHNVITYTELAAKCGHVKIVKLLISSGFDAIMYNPIYLFNFLSSNKSAIKSFNEIVQVLDKWPATMLLIVFDELQVLNLMDPTSFLDFAEFL